MGILQYKALVVIAEDRKASKLYSHAQEFNRRLVQEHEVPVPLTHLQPVGSGLYTFCVLPTGSKVGWPHHRAAEELMVDLEHLAKVGRGRGGYWASTAFVSWGELESCTRIEGRTQ